MSCQWICTEERPHKYNSLGKWISQECASSKGTEKLIAKHQEAGNYLCSWKSLLIDGKRRIFCSKWRDNFSGQLSAQNINSSWITGAWDSRGALSSLVVKGLLVLTLMKDFVEAIIYDCIVDFLFIVKCFKCCLVTDLWNQWGVLQHVPYRWR